MWNILMEKHYHILKYLNVRLLVHTAITNTIRERFLLFQISFIMGSFIWFGLQLIFLCSLSDQFQFFYGETIAGQYVGHIMGVFTLTPHLSQRLVKIFLHQEPSGKHSQVRYFTYSLWSQEIFQCALSFLSNRTVYSCRIKICYGTSLYVISQPKGESSP